MPSTFLSLHYPIVFSTRHREPSIEPAWRSRRHEYFGGTVNGPGGFAQAVGGVAVTVHLLTEELEDFRKRAGVAYEDR